MTSERKINWDAPVVGKIEVGKTYVDRRGGTHTIVRNRADREGRVWYSCGHYVIQNEGEAKHVLDLIAECTPPKPRKMWMNEYDYGGYRLHPSKGEALNFVTFNAIRVAVPVTVTEGHDND